MDIAARIEKNRLAVLAIIAPWFALISCFRARGAKPLPPRIAVSALSVISKLERAAGCLIIASVYAALRAPSRSHALESKALCLAKARVHTTRDCMTMDALHRRLSALWRIVFNLGRIARHLARLLERHRFLYRLVTTDRTTRDGLRGSHRSTAPRLQQRQIQPP